ncbi:MAG: DivIVA domain-containing protein [Clostridia bacterium]|nr:DivIVA domain-containing protein [Deltaproteobacteria bacterium]
MKLTPIDVQQQQFKMAWRGVDRTEVHAFLEMVAAQMSELSRENNELRTEAKRQQREIDDHREREETLREAMLTAQRAIDEIRDHAKKEAQLMVTEAEVRAERVLHNAQSRVNKLGEEVHDLQRQRVRVIEELRGVLNTHVKLIELTERQLDDRSDIASNVTVLERLRAPQLPTRDESTGKGSESRA